MRALALSSLLLLAGCARLGAEADRPAPRPNAEAELRAAERAWLDAYDDHDVEAMRRIVGDEFEIVYPTGAVVDKAGTIAFLSPGTPDDPATSQYTEDTTVRLYGDVAVLRGVYVNEGPNGARRARYTDTWLWRDGRWQVVASHLTHLTRLPD
ncbi:nuclear transport factor 2 family protein [Rubrivirga marina]|uniref:DUF4440 domain-containing protein n=1 Tax=Rubrivirga marina TaxID=1196024 RepID=A0A271IYE5_9BACT|nr:nuclear transport factor 2 family protein [Rubrivirga marina]PAP76222.1 hypothetical protein BSZ37_07080 [Rubrivirga marina]